ncbi:hypothetical protein QUF49_02255 [Fictibacillus sp. b24]|uniref:hypothetical protein n=1 Tax=Fictibacillus sp. b24 TaxID=3055863 RepID=UPI0025A09A1E|nr:hypothetical protein [Fictibacillus sp. b24]MDM5314796.1 hypothetical protein [Fictibacillus sp. b24]
MDKHKFYVDYPEEREIKNHVQFIVSAGLTKPKSFLQSLSEMYQQLGFRYLFRDATEILFTVSLALCVLIYGIFSLDSSIQTDDIYSFIFTLSPVLYFIVASLFLVNALTKNTFAVEMTCKYHVFQLAAFRMLIFSVIALILNSLLIVVVSLLFQSINVLEALLLSSSSLSVFSVLYLYVLQRVKGRYSTYAMMAGWLLVNLLPAFFSQDVYSVFLSHVPVYVYAVVCAASLVLYVNSLKKLIAFRHAEGVL